MCENDVLLCGAEDDAVDEPVPFDRDVLPDVRLRRQVPAWLERLDEFTHTHRRSCLSEVALLTPSPGTPGEGWDEDSFFRCSMFSVRCSFESTEHRTSNIEHPTSNQKNPHPSLSRIY